MASDASRPNSSFGSSSLYKYVDIAGLKRILQGSVRFTQPSAFNDPFELLPELVIPDDEPEGQLNISFDIMANRRQAPPGEMEDIPDLCHASDATSRDIVQQLNNLIGILCLSRVNDSLLMWSHYADQYAGAVIEFDGSDCFFDGCIDVEYRSQRPRRHLSAYSSLQEPLPIAELCAKSEQWQYEHEVRVIRCLSDCDQEGEGRRGFPIYVRRLPAGCIKSVTLGERTSIVEQREIYQLVKETSISLWLAAIDHCGYAFRRELIKTAVPASVVNPWITPRTAHIFTDSPSEIGDIARYLIANHPSSTIVNKPV